MNTQNSNGLTTKQTLTLIALAAGAALLLAFAPGLGWLDYPFRLLLTTVHELGHGLTALLTGGRFERFLISSNGSGLAYTSGGWRLLIVPAGYLGTALFGAGLILVGRSQRWARRALGLIGLVLLISTALYARTVLTFVTSLLFGIFFLGFAWRATPAWIVFFLHLLAIEAAFTSLGDLLGLIRISARFFRQGHNDALSMQQMTFIPAIVWALLWALAAAALLGWAIWTTWIRNGD